MLTLPKKDFASLKKFFNWFQGHLFEEDTKPQKDDPAIKAVIEALKRILVKFHSFQEQQKEEIFQNDGGVQTTQSRTSILTPITIIRSLFNDNFIAEPILEEISVDLIRYIKHKQNSISQGQRKTFM